jgi:hypothetical protein
LPDEYWLRKKAHASGGMCMAPRDSDGLILSNPLLPRGGKSQIFFNPVPAFDFLKKPWVEALRAGPSRLFALTGFGEFAMRQSIPDPSEIVESFSSALDQERR